MYLQNMTATPKNGNIATDLLALLKIAANGQQPSQPVTMQWESLLPLAYQHGVDTFLFNSMLNGKWASELLPPQPLFNQWRQLYFQRIAEAARTRDQLAELLTSLHGQQITAIPLKGSWLSEYVYDAAVPRTMSDIDIFIPVATIDAARKVMEQNGYVARDNFETDKWHKDQHFLNPKKLLGVELQWHVWTPNHKYLKSPDIDYLWSQAVPATIAGADTYTWPAETHLVYLVYHLIAHNWRFPLRAHLDLILFCRHPGTKMDISKLKHEAKIWGLAERLPFVLRVSHDLFGLQLPPELQSLMPTDDNWMMEEHRLALRLALPTPAKGSDVSPNMAEFAQGCLRTKLRIGFRMLFPSPAEVRATYPSAAKTFGLAGAYFTRIYDLLKRRTVDLLPSSKRYKQLKKPLAEMSQRQNLNRKLLQLDS